MYYKLARPWAKTPARVPDRGSYDPQGRWWDDGIRFTEPLTTPIDVRLRPFNAASPDESAALPNFIDGRVPLFSDDLLRAMAAVGIDNLDIYPARLLDPDTGQYHTNYKAVNVIGIMSVADMAQSGATVHDGIPLVDVSFDHLVVDTNKARGVLLFRLAENSSTILVHERVRDHLLAEGFTELEFYNTEDIAL